MDNLEIFDIIEFWENKQLMLEFRSIKSECVNEQKWEDAAFFRDKEEDILDKLYFITNYQKFI